VILDDPHGRPVPPGVAGGATLDDLFRRAVKRRPHAVALRDPPNRASFSEGEPKTLTYAEADRIISAIAGRLRRIGLASDAIVAMQLPNTVEAVLTLLAVLRAGMIAMPLPLLWREADAIAALDRVGASALIVSGRIGAFDQYALALQVASQVFAIRSVCGFGREVPDGVVPLGDLFAPETLDPIPPVEPERLLPPGPAAHLAVVTWDMTPDGLVPVARSHSELATGGLAILLEGRFPEDARMLTTMAMSSFAALAVSLLPWLVTGGTLLLHHPFDPAAFVAQQRDLDVVVLPGPLLTASVDAGTLLAQSGIQHVVAVWRAPERLLRAPAWRDPRIGVVDVQAFGEIGIIPARRGAHGGPTAVPTGPIALPRDAKGAVILGDVRQTANGTVALRGPMVPRRPFPAGIERTTLPHLKIAADGVVDTGYPCRSDRDKAVMLVTGPPPGTISVGGYRFVMRELQDMVGEVAAAATLAALPDAFAGHRLAGAAPDQSVVRQALSDRGANPLLVHAFADRRREADGRGRDA
jgi:hypothetical protein